MLDFNMVSQAQKVELFWYGKKAEEEMMITDFLIADWVHDLVYLLPPESIDSQKFSREWIDFQFDRVKSFFYCMCFGYVLYLYAQIQIQIQLIMYDKEESGDLQYFFSASPG